MVLIPLDLAGCISSLCSPFARLWAWDPRTVLFGGACEWFFYKIKKTTFFCTESADPSFLFGIWSSSSYLAMLRPGPPPFPSVLTGAGVTMLAVMTGIGEYTKWQRKKHAMDEAELLNQVYVAPKVRKNSWN